MPYPACKFLGLWLGRLGNQMIKARLVDNGPLRGASPICVTQSDRNSILFISIEASDGPGHICQAEDNASLMGDPPGLAFLVQNYRDLYPVEIEKIHN